jgi:WD40 repeat protein
VTGKELKTFTGHQGWVWSVGYSPDGHILVTGSQDKMVKLWDVKTGKELKTITGHQDAVSSVMYSPDGKILATSSNDKSVILWNFDLDELMRSGCGWIRNYLANSPREDELQQICLSIDILK